MPRAVRRSTQPKLLQVRICGNAAQSAWVHLPCSYGNDDTMCGIDANDDSVGHLGAAQAEPAAKLSCPACVSMWRVCERLPAQRVDFGAQQYDGKQQ